ncbi:MAG TPA: hypothetical protein VNT28_03220 [Candidatus Limnocylindrales bacterium]|jgi:hypothetical protein|nr:hypothetical protein [Candidatus Limnocylindrales bacterium]
MDRLRTLGIVLAFAIAGVVAVSTLHPFQSLIAQPIALFGSIAMAGLMTFIFIRAAMVPERRHSGWVRTLTSVNTRWLFFLLFVGWAVGMFLLASLGLGPQQMGAPAFVMLFIGIFVMMGFIWAVIGE